MTTIQAAVEARVPDRSVISEGDSPVALAQAILALWPVDEHEAADGITTETLYDALVNHLKIDQALDRFEINHLTYEPTEGLVFKRADGLFDFKAISNRFDDEEYLDTEE